MTICRYVCLYVCMYVHGLFSLKQFLNQVTLSLNEYVNLCQQVHHKSSITPSPSSYLSIHPSTYPSIHARIFPPISVDGWSDQEQEWQLSGHTTSITSRRLHQIHLSTCFHFRCVCVSTWLCSDLVALTSMWLVGRWVIFAFGCLCCWGSHFPLLHSYVYVMAMTTACSCGFR